MKDTRVVITGTGIISSIGNSVDEFWQSLMDVKSGIAPITNFDPTGFRTMVGGEIKNFEITDYMPKKDARRLDTYCHYGVAASDEA
ncbi:MAG: beta-ketoacyl-ACP synthase II, partial [Lentisphaeria bacterium]|nr:beta-ketoacyl-ACP synthase II [Lentisphaeria bacterium]